MLLTTHKGLPIGPPKPTKSRLHARHPCCWTDRHKQTQTSPAQRPGTGIGRHWDCRLRRHFFTDERDGEASTMRLTSSIAWAQQTNPSDRPHALHDHVMRHRRVPLELQKPWWTSTLTDPPPDIHTKHWLPSPRTTTHECCAVVQPLSWPHDMSTCTPTPALQRCCVVPVG